MKSVISYKKILLTHDGSKLASVAISHAASLATLYTAEVVILQVIDASVKLLPAISVTAAMETRTLLNDITKREKKAAKDNLTNIKKQLEKEGISQITAALEEGDARDVIVRYAKQQSCDLVVMATHGRSGIKRALLGSVADDVVRNAPCPVFLIHPTK